jgi:hypothetical protein
MRTFFRVVAVLAIALVLTHEQTESWGRWGHNRITQLAVASLPDSLKRFFETEAEKLAAKSVEPDEARRWDEAEQYRHYIDIDAYGKSPFSALPRQYGEAAGKFGTVQLDTTGTLPWQIERFTEALTAAFRRGGRDSIVLLAGYLGHYVSDAHVPLHTTMNYDGRSTGQRGVHARWESQLPERFGSAYPLVPGTARYLNSPRDEAFRIILESYAQVDSLLALDRQAQISTEGSLVTARDSVGKRVELSDRYYAEYQRLLAGMVERQLQKSVSAVASYWYTAWVNAGRPDLSSGNTLR